MAPRYPETLDALYACCLPDERRFFTTLDAELEKVESFYHDRETDAIRRSEELKAQLRELAEHRRVFHEAEAERGKTGVRRLAQEVGKHVPFVSALEAPQQPAEQGKNGLVRDHGAEALRQRRKVTPPAGGKDLDFQMREFDPEKYQRYKKKLKVAVMEFYKELEILKNYRVRLAVRRREPRLTVLQILNLTGFKKALKKFEKTARVSTALDCSAGAKLEQIRCIDLYMDEKVSKRSFADNRPVDALLKEIEDEYTARFGMSAGRW
jgi:hypothetical protein